MAEGKLKVEENREEEEEIERWANCYSSVHEILLVGDGDFSFSLSLANAFGSASNIVATSLDSHDVLLEKYSKAKSNLESLKKMGATILHGVDAKKMKHHKDLKMRKFDRIIFNFPHAGFKGKEDDPRLIKLHRTLVMGFFKNARHMLWPHKIHGPFRKWHLEELAAEWSLVLKECADFNIDDYPDYNNKRGDGPRCDKSFPLQDCSTFKFMVGDIHNKVGAGKELCSDFQRSFATTGINHSHLESAARTSYLPGYVCNPNCHSSGNTGPDYDLYIQNYQRECCQLSVDRGQEEEAIRLRALVARYGREPLAYGCYPRSVLKYLRAL